MKKIAILYICTGKYKVFWKDFYESSEKLFLNGAHKHYFVFTDAHDLDHVNKNVTIINKECRGFPLDSLFRFDMFLEIEELILPYDYAFFFNANMLFVEKVGSELFPKKDFKGFRLIL